MKGTGSHFLTLTVILGVVCSAKECDVSREFASNIVCPDGVRSSETYQPFKNFTEPYVDFIDSILLHLFQESKNVTQKCQRDTKLLFDLAGRGDLYALKILDATGKLNSGLLEGGIAFPGFFSECLSVTSFNDSRSGFPFSGQYCSVYVQIQSSSTHEGFPKAVWDVLSGSQKPLFFGLCIPSSCSVEDIRYSSNAVISGMFNGSSSGVGSCQVHDEDRLSTDSKAITFLSILGIYIAIAIVVTIFDIYCPLAKNPSERTYAAVPNESEPAPQGFVTGTTNGGAAGTSDSTDSPEAKGVKPHQGSVTAMDENQNMSVEQLYAIPKGFYTFREFMLVLSLRRNAQSIFSVSKASAVRISSLDGIRVLSMMSIIIIHTYFFGTLYLFIRNPSVMKEAPNGSIVFQVFFSSTLAVDSFYFISGTLLAFVTLKRTPTSHGLCTVGNFLKMFYLQRYIRLTPLMMIIIAFCALVLQHVGSGPNWYNSIMMFHQWCQKNWWLDLIYLQNFIDTDNICLSHSWYLATDMQFTLVAPLILLAFSWKFILGAGVLSFLLVASIVTTFVITWIYDLPAIDYINDVVDAEKMVSYFRKVYMMPYCRIGPYLVGFAFGYYLLNNKEKRLSKACIIMGWCGCLVITFAIVFGLWPSPGSYMPPTIQAAFYSSLFRSAWAVLLAWHVVVCFYGYAGCLNSILSWPILEPFSKVTYSAYLIHPVVMCAYYGMLETTVQLSYSFMVYMVLSNVVLTYMISFLLSLLFEFPFISLGRLLWGQRTQCLKQELKSTNGEANK